MDFYGLLLTSLFYHRASHPEEDSSKVQINTIPFSSCEGKAMAYEKWKCVRSPVESRELSCCAPYLTPWRGCFTTSSPLKWPMVSSSSSSSNKCLSFQLKEKNIQISIHKYSSYELNFSLSLPNVEVEKGEEEKSKNRKVNLLDLEWDECFTLVKGS